MKKKELLIIFVLAVLATTGSWFIRIPHFRGAPFPYYGSWAISGHGRSASELSWPFLILDFLFWFLVLAAGWWVVKKLKIKNEKLKIGMIGFLVLGLILLGGCWIWKNLPQAIQRREKAEISKSKCCVECREAFSHSSIGVGSGGIDCTYFIEGGTAEEFLLSQQCAEYFQTYPTKVSECFETVLQENVSITTNKREYLQGETVKIIVRNNLKKSIWGNYTACGEFPFWGLQKLENGEWKEIKFSSPNLTSACDFILCEKKEPSELTSGSEIVDHWELTNICEWPLEPIGVPKTEPKSIEKGTYKLSFTYGLDKNGFDLLEAKIIYSNEFTIKELSGKCVDSNEQCKGKPDGADCTVGIWCDQFGRICGGQSCVGLGLGKCYQEKCLSLEKYENLSKNPQTECLRSCKCMKECNEKGPAYFIPVEEGGPECSVNPINKICCCSGV